MEKEEQTFDQAELELLKEGLKRSYKERFEMATRLYKIQQTMNNASIAHKPFVLKDPITYKTDNSIPKEIPFPVVMVPSDPQN
ncbi:hypothetical protein ATK78_2764 [Pedobacter metabolipauper]|uniref:Uncharacterized protein n=1 Tax=Pedobacter metabolipauper TaxID=425513 RepID=A0A4R6STH4_9SPHI|nr:hypothetical protein ATK78_2764 [Pedobacter metabolipauper]